VRERGAAVLPGSTRPVTFAGAHSITVPAGGDVSSDPVALHVTAFHDLAVSMYVRGDDSSATEHAAAEQISYATRPGAGDRIDALGGGAYVQRTTHRLYVDGLDVLAPGREGAVATIGDSITDGVQPPGPGPSAVGANGRYPDDLQRRLDAAHIPLSVLNAGISGNRLLSGIAGATGGPSALARVTPDAIDQAGVTTVIVLEGINDIGERATTAPALIAGLTQIVTMIHAAGLRAILGTITPADRAGASEEAVREGVNAWIRSERVADGVIDFDAAVRDPANPRLIDPPDDGGDGLHFSLAGYRAMAGAVDLALLRRVRCLS
jgi:lysophospholipase L1-like esterase